MIIWKDETHFISWTNNPCWNNKLEIEGGRKQDEVLDKDDYENAFKGCVSDEFLDALDGSKSQTSN